MIPLEQINHRLLTEYVIKLLSKQQCYTLHEFARESSNKLALITNLSKTDINNIKTDLYKMYGFQTINGLDYYNTRKSKLMVIQTGIQR